MMTTTHPRRPLLVRCEKILTRALQVCSECSAAERQHADGCLQGSVNRTQAIGALRELRHALAVAVPDEASRVTAELEDLTVARRLGTEPLLAVIGRLNAEADVDALTRPPDMTTADVDVDWCGKGGRR